MVQPPSTRITSRSSYRRTAHVALRLALIDLKPKIYWSSPLRSRGDIARTVLYMTLVYRLPIPLDARWLAWLRADPPSETERAFSRWTRARWRIGNPLVEDPEALEMLLFALNWS